MNVGGLLLAAGRSSRMVEGRHKLLAEFEGIPLVRRSAETLLRSSLSPIVVVTGHRSAEICAALHGLSLEIAYNGNFPAGMGTSLAVGFSHGALAGCDGVLIMLADMPALHTNHIDALLAAFAASGGTQVVRGGCAGQPGHPVVVPASLFGKMRMLAEDQGAREVIAGSGLDIQVIELGPAALSDVDTVEAVISAGGTLKA